MLHVDMAVGPDAYSWEWEAAGPRAQVGCAMGCDEPLRSMRMQIRSGLDDGVLGPPSFGGTYWRHAPVVGFCARRQGRVGRSARGEHTLRELGDHDGRAEGDGEVITWPAEQSQTVMALCTTTPQSPSVSPLSAHYRSSHD